MNLDELAPLDRAVCELAIADEDDDGPGAEAAITNIAAAWIQMDDRERATKLHYFTEDTSIGATLRAALTVAAGRYDLGMAAANFAALKGRPWP